MFVMTTITLGPMDRSASRIIGGNRTVLAKWRLYGVWVGLWMGWGVWLGLGGHMNRHRAGGCSCSGRVSGS